MEGKVEKRFLTPVNALKRATLLYQQDPILVAESFPLNHSLKVSEVYPILFLGKIGTHCPDTPETRLV